MDTINSKDVKQRADKQISEFVPYENYVMIQQFFTQKLLVILRIAISHIFLECNAKRHFETTLVSQFDALLKEICEICKFLSTCAFIGTTRPLFVTRSADT